MEPFINIRALIIDMDGVLWHGDQPMPGLADFFQTLREQQIRFILATNNASLTQEQYVIKLAQMGVQVTCDEILTSSMATALYLSKHNNPAESRVFVIGEDGAKQPLLDHGFTLTKLYELNDDKDNPNMGADIVVCGKDSTLSWDKLATATLNIRAGAQFIGTNADTTLPTERGLTHGNGAILAALQAATGITPTIIGKPEPIIYQQALALLGIDPAQTVAIGDRLETDILGAVRTGIRSLMVLSGVSTEDDFKTTDYRPTWVMPDIRAVTQALKN
ncbi:MAG: HAD-IIA family hydrolase [Methylobacter sp.]|uniref:HAD-IIA family hydrolase n=1 Tax=Methylobacter sp. TaxID=2051955 RepID=UPI002720B22F|nr:HAD-IIA family hydrolase [Methylobacter sp.]MDO9270520.1 HAD-IIA family hydrolase [Methylobacter sp.]MDP1665839.1 HAD-IIA family hydrolase [Methylobacter sp.]MDP1970176.1 HAD-IIA family hydrolase [Methylobacter sp.]